MALLLLLLVAVLASQASSCPDECKCEGSKITCRVPGARYLPQIRFATNTTVLDLSGNNILNVSPNSLKNLPNLEELILDGNKIYYLENGAFKGSPKLRKISLQDNNLHFIEEDVFSDLHSLEELYLAGNKIEELPNLHNNPELTKLCVSDNEIEEIPEDCFKDNLKLSELKMKENKLRSIPRDAFPDDVTSYVTLNVVGNKLWEIPEVVEEMTQLSSLSLCLNPIKALKPGQFSTLPRLEMLSMTGVGLTEIPPNVFNLPDLEELYLGKNSITGDALSNLQMPNLKTLAINNNDIEDIPADAFLGLPNLKELDVSNCDVTHIENLPSTLTELNLNGNKLNEVPHLITNLALKEVKLCGNNISRVTEADFSTLVNLDELTMSNNMMTSLEFSGPTTVTSLDLSHNLLGRIPDVVMTSMHNLKSLNVSFNNISSLEEENFRNLPKLTTLNLKGNTLTTIGDDLFESLTNLKNLHLCHNKITEIEENAFSNLPHLEVVTMDDNYVTEIDDVTFASNTKLKKISLNRNELQEIKSEAFENLEELEELWLLDNNLTAPPNIGGNSALRVLGLCDNPLGNLPKEAFKGPKGLEVLLLQNIKMTTLCETAFGNTRSIRNLNLAGENHLQSVPNVIKRMPLLRVLKLSGNPIQDVCVKDFSGLNNLRELRLDSMKLEVCDVTKLFPALPALRSLSLSGNPWRCGCEMQWFALGVGGERARIETEDREEVTCSAPPRLSGRRIDFLRLGDFGQCVSSRVKEVEATSALISLPNIRMLAMDHADVYTKVAYLPLGGGNEKVMRVNKHNSAVRISGLTPNTSYMVCVTTMTSTMEQMKHDVTAEGTEGRETCFRIKTLGFKKLPADHKPGSNAGSSGMNSHDLVIVYVVLGGVLGFVFIIGVVAMAAWCRRSGVERRTRFANISDDHERSQRSGNGRGVMSGSPRRPAERRSRPKGGNSFNNFPRASDDVMVVTKGNGGHVNAACDVIGPNARTKL